MVKEDFYECIRCGRKITREEFEAYDGMCKEFYLVEIDELGTMKTKSIDGKYYFLQWRIYCYKPKTTFF